MNLLVVGDALLDQYTHVKISRPSPENPSINIYNVVKEQKLPGGCLNVAANLASLIDKPVSVAAIISDERLLNNFGVKRDLALSTFGQPLIKHRIVNVDFDCNSDAIQQMLRIDYGQQFSDVDLAALHAKFKYFKNWQQYDAVIVSDYCKGTISYRMIGHLETLSCPVFVDTKQEDLSIWGGIDHCIIKINEREFERSQNFNQANHLIVTKGSEGADYYHQGKQLHSFSAKIEVEAPDPIGAGDTYLAGFVAKYLEDPDIRSAMAYADIVARVSVRQRGTTIVKPDDVKKELWHNYTSKLA